MYHPSFQFIFRTIRRIQGWLGVKSVGVRAIVINEKNEVLLVEHTYVSGWYFPGGGVKSHETVYEGVERELYEETGVTLLEPAALFGVYHHKIRGADDYPVLFVVKHFKQTSVHSPEIKRYAWFPINHLPEGIRPSTEQRIKEYLKQADVRYEW